MPAPARQRVGEHEVEDAQWLRAAATQQSPVEKRHAPTAAERSNVSFMPQRSPTATLGVALSVAGMGALCAGFKVSALSLFGAGVKMLEKDWRARHPEFAGNAAERWQESLS